MFCHLLASYKFWLAKYYNPALITTSTTSQLDTDISAATAPFTTNKPR